MPSGPPNKLEAFVGLWIPPACREEVLGDLHEKYTGPWQYIALAMSVIPFVVLSRIRRTTDIFVLLTDALLIYGSFLAAVWYKDRTSLTGQWGLLRLAIPTVLNLAGPILEHAWDFETKWPRALINGAVVGIGIYFSFSGEIVGVMLVVAVDFAFRRMANVPQAAAGPALWLAPDSSRAKFAFAAMVVIMLEGIIQDLIGIRPAVMAPVFIISLAVALQFSRSTKE
jgi:hypothetical protein